MSLCSHESSLLYNHIYCKDCGEPIDNLKISCTKCKFKQYYKNECCTQCGQGLIDENDNGCANCYRKRPPNYNSIYCNHCGLLYSYKNKEYAWIQGDIPPLAGVLILLCITTYTLWFTIWNKMIFTDKIIIIFWIVYVIVTTGLAITFYNIFCYDKAYERKEQQLLQQQ